jgi:hypothetical protein
MNTVDVYTPPRFEYKAAWMLCKVRAQNELLKATNSSVNWQRKPLSHLISKKSKLPQNAFAALRPLLNAGINMNTGSLMQMEILRSVPC